MDPAIQQLSIQLGEVAARNAAGAVLDRVTAVKARKKHEEIIATLEEIVNDLLADKAELTLIAQALDEQLVAQRLSDEDLAYITENLLPLLEQLASASGGSSSTDMAEVIGPLLSRETLTILQLLGFNFREGIGAPLTDLVSTYIEALGAAKGGGGQRNRKAK